MTTQKIWKEAYSETVLDFTERNPDPSDWVRGQRTDEAQRMRDVLTADISEIPSEDLVTISVGLWTHVITFLDGDDPVGEAQVKAMKRFVQEALLPQTEVEGVGMKNVFKIVAEAVDAFEHDIKDVEFHNGHFSGRVVIQIGGTTYNAVLTIDEDIPETPLSDG